MVFTAGRLGLPAVTASAAPLKGIASVEERVRAVAAGAVDQRLALAIGRALYAAEEHDVIAAGDVRLLDAFEGRQCAEQQRAAADAGSMHDVLELVGHALGEVLGQGKLPGAKHVDGKM